MKQVDKFAARALFARRPSTHSANTKVVLHDGVATLLLHGNAIACYDGNTTHISLAGWDTVTTRARLRAVIAVGGYSASLSRDKGVTCLDGAPFSSNGWAAL